MSRLLLKKIARMRHITFLVGFLFLHESSALASEFELSSSVVGLTAGSTDQLVVGIADLEGLDSRRIYILLDGVDITAFSTFTNNKLRVNPPEGLVNGSHTLVAYQSGQSKSPLGQWVFTVEGAVETEFQAYASLNATYPVSDNIPGNDQGLTADGAFGFEVEADGNEWHMSAKADFIASHNDSGVALNDQRRVDLGDYLLKVEKGRLGAKIGHHSAAPQSLIIRGFNRRGASMSWQQKDGRVNATGFAFRTSPLSGFRHGLGISDNEDRVSGAIVSARPFNNTNTELSLTWLTGERSEDSGAGVIDNGEVSSGDALSVTMATKAANGKLELRGEVAQTDFDFDGSATDLESIKDDALSVAAIYTPLNKRGADRPHVEIGMEYKSVGTFFKSLANQGLPVDVESSRLNALYSYQGFNVLTAIERQQNNVDDNPLLSTIQTDIAQVNLNYSSLKKSEELSWFGRPNFSLSWQTADQMVVNRSDAFPVSLDSTNQQINLGAAFRYTHWDWRIGYNQGEQLDATGQRSDTENRLFNVGANIRVKNRLFLGVLAQSGEREDLRSGQITDDTLFNVTATATLLPQRLQANLSWSKSEQLGSGIDTTSSTLNGGFTWTVRPVTSAQTGISLWLKGTRQDVSTQNQQDDDRYQVFIGVSINYGR